MYRDFVSPMTMKALTPEGNQLVTADHSEAYTIQDSIVDLLPKEALDEAAIHEIDSFEKNPVFNVCYFRDGIFVKAVNLLTKHLDPSIEPICFAELGGGEGYLARKVADSAKCTESYVCDLSAKYLRLAPDNLIKVKCDIKLPVFRSNYLSAAAFWVSLHHFNIPDISRCLEIINSSMKPDGILIIYEPNQGFFPRKILMKSSFLRRIVYFDEQEAHLSYEKIRTIACESGFEELSIEFINPPYSLPYLKKLKFWPIMFAITEFFYLLDRLGISKIVKSVASFLGMSDIWGLYFLMILRKNNNNINR